MGRRHRQADRELHEIHGPVEGDKFPRACQDCFRRRLAAAAEGGLFVNFRGRGDSRGNGEAGQPARAARHRPEPDPARSAYAAHTQEADNPRRTHGSAEEGHGSPREEGDTQAGVAGTLADRVHRGAGHRPPHRGDNEGHRRTHRKDACRKRFVPRRREEVEQGRGRKQVRPAAAPGAGQEDRDASGGLLQGDLHTKTKTFGMSIPLFSKCN